LSRARVSLDMQTGLEPSELVRCLACGVVYGKPLEPADLTDGAACPECGDVGWLALSIPVDETAAPGSFVIPATSDPQVSANSGVS